MKVLSDDARRTRALAFLNVAHFLDHYVLLIFPTVIIGLEVVYGRSYGELLILSTAAFTAFGVFALPCGWLADYWSRRGMMAIFFLGTGISTIAVGLSPNFTILSIALFAVGVFAAIYHPVGIPMVIDNAIHRGRTMSWNGVYGNVGVSIAAGCTGIITTVFGWRYAFFIPGVICTAVGIAYLLMSPDDSGRKVAPQIRAQDVRLDRRSTLVIITLFMSLSVSSGLLFNSLSITLPKIVDVKTGVDIPLALASSLATVIFLCGAATLLLMGRLVERFQPHLLLAAIGLLQVLGSVWSYYASGWILMVALALSIASIYGQVTLGDFLMARYTSPNWRGRLYAFRFFLVLTPSGLAVWGMGWLYDHGGVKLLLAMAISVAVLFALNALAISYMVSDVESRRARGAAQPAE
ncbi:MAG: MFS transporter [Pseudorhodoplanes sp.]